MIMIDVMIAKVAAMRKDFRNISSLRLFKSWIAEMPMMKKAVRVYAEAMTCQNLIHAYGLPRRAPKDVEHRLAPDQLVPAGPLHPPVGQQDPQRGQRARAGHDPHDARVHAPRDPLPAEHPHADEGGFQEEGHRGLDGQRGAEDVSDELRVLGPVHAELELQGDARDHTHGEVHEEEPAPVFRHRQVRLVPGPRVAGLHPGDHDGEPEGEGNEEEVKEGNGGKLDPGEYRDTHA